MKFTYKLKKDISFLLIVIIGINYLLFLTLAFFKIIPGFLMQIIFILDFIKQNDLSALGNLLTTFDFYVNIISGILVATLITKAILSFIKEGKRMILTKKYINNLSKIDFKKYILIDLNSFEAFTYGFFKPKIYISKKAKSKFGNEELNAVLYHEYAHVEAKDPFRQLIIRLIKNSLPFLPFKSFLFSSFEVLTELSADSYASHRLNSSIPLFSSLFKFKLSKRTDNLNFSHFQLNNDRLLILLEQKKFTSYLFFLLTILFLILIFTNTLFLSHINIFMACSHLKECFDFLITGRNSFKISSQEICMQHATNVYEHCIKLYQSVPQNMSLRSK